MDLSAEEVIKLLNLSPHPTCGMVRQSYVSKITVPGSDLPPQFKGARQLGSVLYFMVTPQTQIKLHKIHSDQMYHFYCGDPLDVLLLYSNGNAEIKRMGHDLNAGMLPQVLIPGDTFHMSKLTPQAKYSLLATTEWPAVAPEDVELGNVKELMTKYSFFQKEILDFTNGL